MTPSAGRVGDATGARRAVGRIAAFGTSARMPTVMSRETPLPCRVGDLFAQPHQQHGARGHVDDER